MRTGRANRLHDASSELAFDPACDCPRELLHDWLSLQRKRREAKEAAKKEARKAVKKQQALKFWNIRWVPEDGEDLMAVAA